MENPGELTLKLKYNLVAVICMVILLLTSLCVMSQDVVQNPDRSSQAEQSSAYLQNIEQDPNGVPNSTAWYAQPWIWAIVAAILILCIAMLTRNKEEAESDS